MNRNRISTTQLAEICGVSQGTVDRALNNRKGISPVTKERILEVAREYGYCPDIDGNMAAPKTALIGIIVPDLEDPFLVDSLAAIEKCVTAEGASTVVMFTEQDAEREIECIRNLYSMSVDGLVICPANSGPVYESYLRSLKIPTFTIIKRLNDIPYLENVDEKAIYGMVEDMLHKDFVKN